MKRLLSGRSVIVPLPLHNYHHKSVPEDLSVSLSVLTTENKLV
jgi:hypothetical protein